MIIVNFGEKWLSYIAPFVFFEDFELIHNVSLKTLCNKSIPWDSWVNFLLLFFFNSCEYIMLLLIECDLYFA